MEPQFSTTPVVITRSSLETVDGLANEVPDANVTEIENSTVTSPPAVVTTSASFPGKTSPTLMPATSSSSTPSSTIVLNPLQCPDLFKDLKPVSQDAQPVNITSVIAQAMPNQAMPNQAKTLLINSSERTPGTVVMAKCSSGYIPSSITYLECQPSGLWNDSLPACAVMNSGLSTNTLYFAVIGGVCGLSVLVLAILYCHLLKSRKKRDSAMPPSFDPDRAIYVDPYAIGERLYAAPAPVHYARSDITYAKPKIYSTYLNPSFYEDAYDRWRRQEQQVAEKLYDSPWLRPRNSQHGSDNSDLRWNQTGVKAVGDARDLDRFRRIPRAQLSIDQSSVKSTDSFGQTNGGMSRSRGLAYGRHGSQGSVLSSHSIKFQNMNPSEPPFGHLVKAYDDAPPPPLPPIDHFDIGDGRTQF